MSMTDSTKRIAPQAVLWTLAILVGVTDSFWVGYTVLITYGPWVFALSLLCFGLLTTYFMHRSLTDALETYARVGRNWFELNEQLVVRWLLMLAGVGVTTVFVFYLYHSSMVQTFNLLTVKLHIGAQIAFGLAHALIIPAMITIGAMMAYDFIQLVDYGFENRFMFKWLLMQPQTKNRLFKMMFRLALAVVGGVLAFLVAAITTSVLINGFLRYQSIFKLVALPHTGPQMLLFIALFLLSARLLIGAGKRLGWGVDYVIDKGVTQTAKDLKAFCQGLTWQQWLELVCLTIALPFRAFLTGKFFSTQAGSPLNTNPHMVTGAYIMATDLNDVPLPVEICADVKAERVSVKTPKLKS